MGSCIVCQLEGCERKEFPDSENGAQYVCKNCGTFSLDGIADAIWSKKKLDAVNRAILSHAIFRRQQNNREVWLDTDELALLQSEKLPSPAEQASNTILWIGDNSSNPARWHHIVGANFAAAIGAVGSDGVAYVVNSLISAGYIERSPGSNTRNNYRLTFKGWQEYEKLKMGQSDSRKVFMAMPFSGDDGELVEKVYQAFKPAVEATGFELSNPLLEMPKAGLIDDYLRVEIRRARFLIADLTGNNRGAYWEAGFAEGLSKHVIYTCEEGHKIHFDTRNLTRIEWSLDRLGEAADKLKAMIRNTFPADARMDD